MSLFRRRKHKYIFRNESARGGGRKKGEVKDDGDEYFLLYKYFFTKKGSFNIPLMILIIKIIALTIQKKS
jgi:hypothetical protein